MEMEYQPRGRRGRVLMVLGVVLAIGAGAGVLFVLSQAQSQSTADNTPKVAVVVAAVPIPARKTIEASDVAVHEVDADTVAGSEGLTDPTQVIGRVAAVATSPRRLPAEWPIAATPTRARLRKDLGRDSEPRGDNATPAASWARAESIGCVAVATVPARAAWLGAVQCAPRLENCE